MTKKELLQRINALVTILDQDPDTNIKNLAIDNIHISKKYYEPCMLVYTQESLRQILKEEGIK